MAAQSIASRTKRPAPVEPDDVVLARALEFAEWARRNVVVIVGAAGVLLVVIAGLFWYRADRDRRLENAAIAFLQVEQSLYTGDDAIAVRDIQQYIQQYGATPYGDEARVLLGQIHLQAGRPAEAIQALEPVAERIERSPVGAQAALLLAGAQEAAGDIEGAVRTYLRVAEDARTQFQREEGLVGAALLRSQSGNHAAAADLYRRLVQMSEPGSANRSLYEMRQAEAESLATAQ